MLGHSKVGLEQAAPNAFVVLPLVLTSGKNWSIVRNINFHWNFFPAADTQWAWPETWWRKPCNDPLPG